MKITQDTVVTMHHKVVNAQGQLLLGDLRFGAQRFARSQARAAQADACGLEIGIKPCA